MKAVATVGPISVAANIGPLFNQYHDGVHYDPECSKHPMHAVSPEVDFNLRMYNFAT